MIDEDFEIRFVDSWSTEEIINLYKAGGWWSESSDPSKIQKMIKGSMVFAVIVENSSGKAVGMGRLISDGVSDAYIQDMVVLPEFRGRDLGKQLVKRLIDFCRSKDIIWLGLIAEPGYDNFYDQVGFKQMKKYIPMLYKED